MCCCARESEWNAANIRTRTPGKTWEADPKKAQDRKSRRRSIRGRPGFSSWILMLFVIFLAMLVATGIAWTFIHPMLHPH